MEERFIKITLTLDDLTAKVYGKVLESIKGGKNVESANRWIFEMGLVHLLNRQVQDLKKEGESMRGEIEECVALLEEFVKKRKEKNDMG